MGDAGAIIGVGFLVLAWVGVSMVMPIAAFVSARRARRELELVRIELRELRRQSAGVPPPPVIINDARVAPPVAVVAPTINDAPVATEAAPTAPAPTAAAPNEVAPTEAAPTEAAPTAAAPTEAAPTAAEPTAAAPTAAAPPSVAAAAAP